jgi:hypothetical protein
MVGKEYRKPYDRAALSNASISFVTDSALARLTFATFPSPHPPKSDDSSVALGRTGADRVSLLKQALHDARLIFAIDE